MFGEKKLRRWVAFRGSYTAPCGIIMFSSRMNILDISSILEQLASVPDELLRNELRELSFDVPDWKFHTAFSAYGATKLLASLDENAFSGGLPIPSGELAGIRHTSVLLLRLYASLVYMRSDTLERGLDSVLVDSKLSLFNKLYRSGSKKKNESTLPQHIRNALCHGGIEFLDNGNLRFTDRSFKVEMPGHQVSDLCHHVFRLYCLAFEAQQHGS